MVDQTFSPDSPQVIANTTVSILFLFGICINSLSIYKLSRKILAKKGSQMTLLLLNLSVADLIVILYQVLEMWIVRHTWKADEATCKIYGFFGTLGFYISGFVMMVISVDRWSAIVHPLERHTNRRRTKIMLTMAWLLPLVCSIPNCLVQQLRTGPGGYRYCTSADFFVTDFCVYWIISVCLLPLITILGCHTSMIVHLYRRSKTTLGQQGAGWAAEAKVRTVKITSVLTLGFVICWMPFIVLILWSYIDHASVWNFMVDHFMVDHIACVNNCLNPLFYGMVGKKWISWKKFFGKRKRQDSTEKTTTTQTLETVV